MELIKNEKSRMVTYHKRKKGLLKKAEEIHILCNVDACVIILGPKNDVETWPLHHDQVLHIIDRYRSSTGQNPNVHSRRTQDLFDYFAVRKKKVDDKTAKIRKANFCAKFPAWHGCLNLLTLQQLCSLEAILASKLQAAESRVLELKKSSEKCLIQYSDSLPKEDHSGSSSTFHQQAGLVCAYSQGFDMFQDFDMYVDPALPLNQMDPIEANNQILRLAMNEDDFSHFGNTTIGSLLPSFGF